VEIGQKIKISANTLVLCEIVGSKACNSRIVGKRTAGIDGAKWITPNSKMNAALKLSDTKYKAKPLRRVYIPKPGTDKKRPLGIPTMYDRAMQAL